MSWPSFASRLAPLALLSLCVLTTCHGGHGAGTGAGGTPPSPDAVLAPGAQAIEGALLDAAVVAPSSVGFPRPLGDGLLSLAAGSVIFSQYDATTTAAAVTQPFLRVVSSVWSDDSMVWIDTEGADVGDAFVSFSDDQAAVAASASAQIGEAQQADNPTVCAPDPWSGTAGTQTGNQVVSYPEGTCVDPTLPDQCFVDYLTQGCSANACQNCGKADLLGLNGTYYDAAEPYTALKVGWVRVGADNLLNDTGSGVTQGDDADTLQTTIKNFHALGLRVLVNVTEGVVKSPDRCAFGGPDDTDVTNKNGKFGRCGYAEQCSSFLANTQHDVLGLDKLFGIVPPKVCGLQYNPPDPYNLQSLVQRWGGDIDTGYHLIVPTATTGTAYDYYYHLFEGLKVAFTLPEQPDAWEILNEPDASVGDRAFLNLHVMAGILVQAYRAYDEVFFKTHLRKDWSDASLQSKSCAYKAPRIVAGALQDTGPTALLTGAIRVALDALDKAGTWPAGGQLFDSLSFHIYNSNPATSLPKLEQKFHSTLQSNTSPGFLPANCIPPTSCKPLVSATYGPYWVTEVGVTTCTDPDNACASAANGCVPPGANPVDCHCGTKQEGHISDLVNQAGALAAANDISHIFIFGWNDTSDMGGANYSLCNTGAQNYLGEAGATRQGGGYGLVNGLDDGKQNPLSHLANWCPTDPNLPTDADGLNVQQKTNHWGMVKRSWKDVAVGALTQSKAKCADLSSVGVPEMHIASTLVATPWEAGQLQPEGATVQGCVVPAISLQTASDPSKAAPSPTGLSFDWGGGMCPTVKTTETKIAGQVPEWSFSLAGPAQFTIDGLRVVAYHAPGIEGDTTFEFPLPGTAGKLVQQATYLAAFRPVPIFVSPAPTLRCVLSGSLNGTTVYFSGHSEQKTLTLDLAYPHPTTLSPSSADADQWPATAINGDAANGNSPLIVIENNVTGPGSIQCDVGVNLILRAFDEPLLRVRVGWGFRYASKGKPDPRPCEGTTATGLFVSGSAIPRPNGESSATVTAFPSAAPTAKPQTCTMQSTLGVCTCKPNGQTCAGDPDCCNGSCQGGKCGDVCDPPPGATPPAGASCAGVAYGQCAGGPYPSWRCDGTCNHGHPCSAGTTCLGTFDAAACGCASPTPSNMSPPGGIFGCFAQGCYAYPADPRWMCIDACWFFDPDTSHEGCATYDGK